MKKAEYLAANWVDCLAGETVGKMVVPLVACWAEHLVCWMVAQWVCSMAAHLVA